MSEGILRRVDCNISDEYGYMNIAFAVHGYDGKCLRRACQPNGPGGDEEANIVPEKGDMRINGRTR